jgi:hypothetical protein
MSEFAKEPCDRVESHVANLTERRTMRGVRLVHQWARAAHPV